MSEDNMQALLIAALAGLMIVTCGCDVSAAEPSSRPSQSDAASQPATTQASLDIETARRALIEMIEASNDAELKTKLPDLLKDPDEGYGDTRPRRTYRFTDWCEISPFHKTWVIRVILPGRDILIAVGKFQEKEGGGWEAVMTRRGGPGARGGIPASH